MAQAQRPTYGDPAYQVRHSLALGAVAAGNGGVTAKYVAHANLLLFDLTLQQTTLSTSTYTVNGVATVSSQQISLIAITNANAFTTSSASLSTATYGPFTSGGYFTSGGTGTAQVSSPTQYALNTTAGVAGYGGIPVNAGVQLYAVSGTDATAVSIVNVGYQINTGAGLTV